MMVQSGKPSKVVCEAGTEAGEGRGRGREAGLSSRTAAAGSDEFLWRGGVTGSQSLDVTSPWGLGCGWRGGHWVWLGSISSYLESGDLSAS